ncbi:MAG TPA: carboxypeptidase regulatory-like domain-containing protein [Terriglobia bacterium]|nr:carboxypeptidase regulatory-like domain-containing protein [Terriglobia bacterium]
MGCKKAGIVAIFAFTFFLLSSPLFGQATGSLLGTVADASGAVVPGATVSVTSQGTGAARETKTDDTGHYLVPLLPIGTYSITVSAQGLKTIEQKDIVLQVDENREVDFSLPAAAVQQTVEVSATAVAVNTSNASLGQVITSQEVAQLPLNGRNFVQLATLTPGTSKETNPGSFFNGGGSSEVGIRGSFSLSVAGSRANSTDWLLDGVDNNELTAGGIAILPSIDALEEFKVLTYTYSAQYGTRGGPTVLLTTKSGTNQFHGTLFEFLRNTSLNTRNFFAPTTPEYIQNQFGGALGGPIKKDKTFFFIDYQGKRTAGGGLTYTATVPTMAMRNGDFSEPFAQIPQLYNPYSTTVDAQGNVTRSPFMCNGNTPLPTDANGIQAQGTPCNIIPGSLINPVGQAMMNLYAAPNVPNTLVGDFVNTPTKQLKEGEFDVRLDHNFSSKDSLFARFSYDQATVFQPVGTAGYMNPDGFTSTQSLADHGRNAALSETHVFSPTTLNKITGGFDRVFNHILSYANGSCISNTIGGGIPGANLGGVSCGLTDALIGGGFWGVGDRGYAPFQGGTNVFSVSDSFDMVRGAHEMSAGAELRANQMNVLAEGFQDGFWVLTSAWTAPQGALGGGGNNMADFLLGLADLGLHDQNFQGAITGRRWKLFRPYFEDTWRVAPNLTVNLGLAWALVTPITEAHNRQSNFNFQTGQFLVAGQNAGPAVGIQTDLTAFEPRFGIAWSPRGDRKTSVRAGYSIYHDSSWNQGGQGLWQNQPYWQESAVGSFFFPDVCVTDNPACTTENPATGQPYYPASGYLISQGFPLLTQPTSPSQYGGNVNAQNLNFKQGRIQQFNLNVERQLPGNILLTVGYAGARSNHLLSGDSNVNLGSPTACGTVPGYTFGCGLTQPYVFPSPIGFVYDIFDRGNSRYDSLQVKAETKTSHGLYALVGYTYSTNFDNGLSDGLGSTNGAVYYPLPGANKADKGLSQINLRHNFTASVVYDLPFGKGKHWGYDWSGAANAVLGSWQINVIQHITSGFPIFMVNSFNTSGVNFQWNGAALNRPDRVCNGRLSHWTIQEYFDTSCFVPSATGELGNSDRTPLSGPGFVNTDFSLIKNIPLRETMALQFRAEFFNLWNTPQFAQPANNPSVGYVADVSAAGFGEITQTVNNPRLIQFALKLTF